MSTDEIPQPDEGSIGRAGAASAPPTDPPPPGRAGAIGPPPAYPPPPGLASLAGLPALLVARPPFRRLRIYAFDPTLSTQIDNASINHITIKVPWEYDPLTGRDILEPGPIGEYVEVIDFDPASNCFYAPVDLNHPYLLAQDGLDQSEANPQFHQQMVYAVAMTTIRNFERALGRTVLWNSHYAASKRREEFVRRLRIYPHALREPNAYYSPQKKALLFGYFPAATTYVQEHLPGGMVFTCLSHDIVAHETTHAILDGMHRRFNEPSNVDVLAFHEAFADIVALFQHFSFPEVIRHQIAKTRGDLSSENLLGKLAQEFGHATGAHGALRDTIGGYDSTIGKWAPRKPDPSRIQTATEPHERGSILVAAVFHAFLTIYRTRTSDLLRIASDGTGILRAGDIHPDLVERLASEAAKAAQHVLNMCIRALDYCPPVDLTFGDYLRALITADFDLVPDDDLGYRIAVVEAFRAHGIYPRDVRNLSIDSLRWEAEPDEQGEPAFFRFVRQMRDPPGPERKEARNIRDLILQWDLKSDREEIFNQQSLQRARLHNWIGQEKDMLRKIFRGLDLDTMKFEVHSLRPARRVGPDGEQLADMVIEIMQRRDEYLTPERAEAGGEPDFVFRGGATLIIDLETYKIRYYINKNINSQTRLKRQRAFLSGDDDGTLRALYFGTMLQSRMKEPFAFLHRSAGEEEMK
jgi:hypothetical protein